MKDKKLKHLESTNFESTPLYNLYNYNNLVDTCNIALYFFFKCDVTKFRIPPPLSHNITLCRHPLPPLTCDVISGCPLRSDV